MEELSYADGVRLIHWDYLQEKSSHRLRPVQAAMKPQSIEGLFSR